MTDQNKELVRNLVDSVFNGRDPSAARRYIADGFESGNPQIPAGADGFQRFAEDIQRALSDFRGEIRDMIAEGDKVVGRFTCTATHRGTWRGHPPTGRPFRNIAEVYIFTVRDNRITNAWGLEDTYGRMRQLGLLAEPHGGSRSGRATPSVA